jgi:hypothetical protein
MHSENSSFSVSIILSFVETLLLFLLTDCNFFFHSLLHYLVCINSLWTVSNFLSWEVVSLR